MEGARNISSVLVIVGPTAAGKTRLALELATRLPGVEIVSADSRQIYRGLDIGTAKPTAAELKAVPHHMIDIINPDAIYSAGRFADDARPVIDEISGRGGIPIVVGGSGFYVQALFAGLGAPPADPAVYAGLEREAAESGYDALYRRLQEVDPEAAAAHSPHNHVKTLRALACHIGTGRPYSSFAGESALGGWDRSPLYIGIAPDRGDLYARINARVGEMMEEGLIAETEALLARGWRPDDPGMKTVGYREVVRYLAGEIPRETMESDIRQATRRYAKRQMTWFRRVEGIRWMERPDTDRALEIILRHRS